MKDNRSLTVGLVYDLRSEYLAEGYSEDQVAEFDSQSTIDSLAEAIASLGHQVDRIGHAWALCGRLVAGDRWDLVFNIAEGLAGRCRESQVPAILELYDIPYTFADPLVCAAALDKAFAKRLVRAVGLNTPRFHVVSRPEDLGQKALQFPVFAKPVAEGTGKGISARSRVDAPEQLAEVVLDLLSRFRQPVLVEEFLPGREFTVGILGARREARVLGTMEVEVLPPEKAGVYCYQSKENCEKEVRYSLLKSGRLRVQVEKVALKAYLALDCRDAGRVDIRLDGEGLPSFLELNPLPGLHPTHSDLPMIATQEGMSYTELIGSILASALSRTEEPHGAPAVERADPVQPA